MEYFPLETSPWSLVNLDTILNHLNRNSDGFKSVFEIRRDLESEFKSHELQAILNKLAKDGYVDFIEKNEIASIRYHTDGENIVRYYSISYEGRVFLDLVGGYVKQAGLNLSESIRLDKLENDQRESRNQLNFLTKLIAAGTLVAAVYYLYFLIRDLCQCQFFWQK